MIVNVHVSPSVSGRSLGVKVPVPAVRSALQAVVREPLTPPTSRQVTDSAPGSKPNVKVGVGSLPVTAGEVADAAGGVLSKRYVAVRVLRFPAASAAVSVNVQVSPEVAGSAAVGRNVPVPFTASYVQAPARSPLVAPRSAQVTVAPGSAVKANTGRGSLPGVAGEVAVADGAVVSSRYVAGLLVVVFPASSRTVIVNDHSSPSVSGRSAAGAKEPVPFARSAAHVVVRVPLAAPVSRHVTDAAPGSKVKLKTGRRSLPVTAGATASAAGAVVSRR